MLSTISIFEIYWNYQSVLYIYESRMGVGGLGGKDEEIKKYKSAVTK